MFSLVFYKTLDGNEIVLDFIRSFDTGDRRKIGEALKSVQIGFPIGMPLCRHLDGPLWETRVSLPSKREVRLIFFQFNDVLIVINVFVKKSQKTPQKELRLAHKRMSEFF